MRTKLSFCAFMLCLILAGKISAQTTDQPRTEIEVRGFYSIPTGETKFSTTTSVGDTISFGRDVDFHNELGYEVRVSHRTQSAKHKFLADYTDINWDRSRTLSRNFTFLGQTYLANLQTSSELKLRTFRVMYAYRWGNEKIRFGPMFDMGVITTRLEFNGATNTGTRSSEGKITKFAATVGYDLEYNVTPNVNLFNNLGWIKFKRDNLFHIEGGVKYFPTTHFGVSGGYNLQRYKLEDNDNFLTVRANGPFAGGVVRF
ncbi:MAG TPA: hypothetical protein VGP85_21980 [Pyrinomonadaceae bacterium]|jgi:hypothetical protein|nr:hypothetical protein [Pyrinomonadaceae bacterium]